MTGLTDLDEASGLATFGAGTTGPALEAALAPRGLTLGHYPQSWEYSTRRRLGRDPLGRASSRSGSGGSRPCSPAAGSRHRPARSSCRPTPPPRPARTSASSSSARRAGSGSSPRRPSGPSPIPDYDETFGVLPPRTGSGRVGARPRRSREARLPLAMVRAVDPARDRDDLRAGRHGRGASVLLRGYLGRRGVGAGAVRSCSSALAGRTAAGRGGRRRGRRRSSARTAGSASPGVVRAAAGSAKRFRGAVPAQRALGAGYAVDTLETAVDWSRLPRARRRPRPGPPPRPRRRSASGSMRSATCPTSTRPGRACT